MRALVWATLVVFWVQAAGAVPCESLRFDGAQFTVCHVDMQEDDLRLFLDGPNGQPFGQFDSIDGALAAQGEMLAFAMNAGMFHPDRSPVGHYIEKGIERRGVITSAGPGNFGLLPNGVFCIEPRRTSVIESRAYAGSQLACSDATQSGPMLVIDGALHPRFLQDSTSLYVRNGVGVSEDGRTAHFAISDQPVNFHHFARLFRDRLETPNALYFDGNVSRLHAPILGRSDPGRALGPIIGVVVPR